MKDNDQLLKTFLIILCVIVALYLIVEFLAYIGCLYFIFDLLSSEVL